MFLDAAKKEGLLSGRGRERAERLETATALKLVEEAERRSYRRLFWIVKMVLLIPEREFTLSEAKDAHWPHLSGIFQRHAIEKNSIAAK